MIENLTQSINSFIRPLRLSLSNSEQILTKAAIASFAIVAFANLSSVEAEIEDNNIVTGDIYDFSTNPPFIEDSECKKTCFKIFGIAAGRILNTCLFYCDHPFKP